MPIASPLHERTAALCRSLRFKDWAGYHAVCSYQPSVESEYHALRQACGMLDVSPLYKLEVRGPEAADFLSWIWTRDLRGLREGQVAYGCWCDEEGKVLDDGTAARLRPDRFRLTSAEPSFGWLDRRSRGWRVEVEDVSEGLAAIALQGPRSRAVLVDLCGPELGRLGYFRVAAARAGSIALEVSRTGYTGDLGYELWVEASRAPALWDLLMEAGQPHRITPVGLDALDVTRLEAGFFLGGVDYVHAAAARTEAQKSSPFELGMGWAVKLDREPFVGQLALKREKERGSRHALVGLESEWDALEALYAAHGLPAALSPSAWRTAVPVFQGAQQVGRATSGCWSPLLKRNLALATVEAGLAAPGTRLEIEVTVEYERRSIPCTVVRRPFLELPRKRA